MRYFSFLSLSILLLTGCARKSVEALRRNGIHVSQQAVTFQENTSPDNLLQIQYLGCGGLLIRQGAQSIMIDPFFSNQPFLKVGKAMYFGGKIRSSPSQIALGRKKILSSIYNNNHEQLKQEVKAIFSAHGHYDHLMDIPYIHHHWLDQKPDIYVNTSSFNILGNVIAPGKLHNIEARLSNHSDVGQSVDLGSSDGTEIKIYPIEADHNPHTKKNRFFCGTVMKPPPRFKTPEAKTRIYDWLDGKVISFLIDIEQNNNIVFRLFVQSSSCEYPRGIPPENLLKKKKVDLAILGVASYGFSASSYPCRYLEELQSDKVMFIHWEDFFRRYDHKTKSVMRTDIVEFFNELLPACRPVNYVLPVPGVVINFKY